LEAARQKARRGELQFRLPIGYRWTQDGKIEIDPDRRVQQAIELMFNKTPSWGVPAKCSCGFATNGCRFRP